MDILKSCLVHLRYSYSYRRQHQTIYRTVSSLTFSKPHVMKLKLVLVLITALAITINAKAQDYQTAVGIRLSSHDAAINNSISLKHFVNSNLALEGLLSFGDPVALGVLVESHHPINGAAGLNWLVGGGAYVGFGGTRNFGAQGIVGLDYKIASIPLNLSLDWKPELNFIR